MGISLGGSKKKTTQQIFTETYNQALEDVNAPVLAGVEGDVNLTLTDRGAVADALGFAGGVASDVVDTTQALAERAYDSADYSLDRSLDFGREALDFGGESLGFAGDTVGQSYDFGQQALDTSAATSGKALNAVDDALTRALNFAQDLVSKTGQQLNATTATVIGASRSDTAATLDTFIKYGAGIMAAFFLVQVIKKKG